VESDLHECFLVLGIFCGPGVAAGIWQSDVEPEIKDHDHRGLDIFIKYNPEVYTNSRPGYERNNY